MSGNMQPFNPYITPQPSPQLMRYGGNVPADVSCNAPLPPSVLQPGGYLIDASPGGVENRETANPTYMNSSSNNNTGSAAGKFSTMYHVLPGSTAPSSVVGNMPISSGSGSRENRACTPAVFSVQAQGNNNTAASGPNPIGNPWSSGDSESYNSGANANMNTASHGTFSVSRNASVDFAANHPTTQSGAAEWSASTPDQSGRRTYNLYAATTPSTPSGASAADYMPMFSSAGNYVEAPVDLCLYRAGPTQSSHLALGAAQGFLAAQRCTPSALTSPASHYEMVYRSPLRRPPLHAVTPREGLLTSPVLHRVVSAPSSSSMATASQTRLTPHSVSSSLSAVSGRWPGEEGGRMMTQVPMSGTAATVLYSALPLPGVTSYYPLTAMPMPPLPATATMMSMQPPQSVQSSTTQAAGSQDQGTGRIMSVRSFMAPPPVGCVDIPNNALIPTVPGLALPRPPQGRLPPDSITAC